jgi:hypothetical protein
MRSIPIGRETCSSYSHSLSLTLIPRCPETQSAPHCSGWGRASTPQHHSAYRRPSPADASACPRCRVRGPAPPAPLSTGGWPCLPQPHPQADITTTASPALLQQPTSTTSTSTSASTHWNQYYCTSTALVPVLPCCRYHYTNSVYPDYSFTTTLQYYLFSISYCNPYILYTISTILFTILP